MADKAGRALAEVKIKVNEMEENIGEDQKWARRALQTVAKLHSGYLNHIGESTRPSKIMNCVV